MTTPKNPKELEELLKAVLPGAVIQANQQTWEVIIHTNRFLADGDATDTLMTQEQQEASNKAFRAAGGRG